MGSQPKKTRWQKLFFIDGKETSPESAVPDWWDKTGLLTRPDQYDQQVISGKERQEEGSKMGLFFLSYTQTSGSAQL